MTKDKDKQAKEVLQDLLWGKPCKKSGLTLQVYTIDEALKKLKVIFGVKKST